MTERVHFAEAARLYASMGLRLVPNRARTKRPVSSGWNQDRHLITDPERAERVFGGTSLNIGVHLASSGLCSLDLDALPLTRELFNVVGLDVGGLLDAGWRIQGNPDRSRVMFRAPEDIKLPARKYQISAAVARQHGVKMKEGTLDSAYVTIFELRGGGPNEQDILPPSVHPDGHVYQTIGQPPASREEIPELPGGLTKLWLDWDKATEAFARHLQPGNAGSGGAVSAIPGIDRSSSAPRDADVEPGGYLDVARRWSELHGHDFGELLARHGYEKSGAGRWLSPGSQTGLAGVRLLKDGRHVISHHGSDVLAGRTERGEAIPRDLFDCFCLLEHGGVRRAAFHAAALELGLAGPEVDFSSDDQDSETADSGITVGPSRAPLRRPLRTLTPAQLRSLPAVQWLVKGILPKRGLAMLYGQSGVGKSLVLLDLCYAVARGVPWHGAEVRPGGVLYIAAEGSSGFAARQAAYEQFHGICLDEVPFLLVPEGIDLLGQVDAQRVIDAAAQLESPALIVLDTLNRVMPGGDENSPECMGKVIAAASSIAEETRALVLVVHHAGKDEQRGARGHSSLRAAVDTELEVRKERDGVRRTLRVTKQRDGQDDLEHAFKLVEVELQADPDTGEPRTAPVAVEDDHSNPELPGPRGRWQLQVWEAIEELYQRLQTTEDMWAPIGEVLEVIPVLNKREGGEPLGDRWRTLAKQALRGLATKGLVEEIDGQVRIVGATFSAPFVRLPGRGLT